MEKEQKSVVAGINHEINSLQKKIENNKDEFLKIGEEAMSSESVYEFIRYNNYKIYLKEDAERLAQQLIEKELQKEYEQQKLIEIMTNRKSYEKLREKQFEIYKKEVAAEEAKLLDDYISAKSK